MKQPQSARMKERERERDMCVAWIQGTREGKLKCLACLVFTVVGFMFSFSVCPLFFFLRVAKSAVAFACALLVLLPTPGNVGRSPVANGEPRNTMTWGLDTCFLSLCLFLLFPSGYLVTTFLSSPLPHGSWFDVVFH